MTLRHLKIFVTVCETGSVTTAGEKLSIAQPSVSLAISDLENYYGIKLFDRIAKRLHITEVGRQFLQYATHIDSLFYEMETGIKNWDSVGILRIGSSITIGNHLLPSLLQEMKILYPNLQVHVTIDNSEEIENNILDNAVDIGLIEGNIHSPMLVYETFREDFLTFICPPQHPFANQDCIALYDLQGEHFLLREKGSAGREIFDRIVEANNLIITQTWQSISTNAIIKGVSYGFGISLLPELLVKEYLKQNSIATFRVKGISLSRNFSLLYHKNKFLTESARGFLNLCRNIVPEL